MPPLRLVERMGQDAPPTNNPFDALPSPAASSTDTLSSTTLASPTQDTPGAAGYGLLERSGIMPSEPGGVANDPQQPFTSPPIEELVGCDLDLMNVAVGGALAPTPSADLPVRSPSRADRALRLPSFEELGIAAPHPDRHREDVSASHATREAMCELQIPRMTTRCPSPGKSVISPVAQLIATLTPPAERQEPDWKLSHVPTTNPGAPTLSLAEANPQIPSSTDPDAVSGGSSLNLDRPRAWYDGAVDALLANISSAPIPNNALKIISHALPSPSTAGHVFPSIISRINDSAPVSPATPLTWINVFHAIPGRFNLADLPVSFVAVGGGCCLMAGRHSRRIGNGCSACTLADLLFPDVTSRNPRSRHRRRRLLHSEGLRFRRIHLRLPRRLIIASAIATTHRASFDY